MDVNRDNIEQHHIRVENCQGENNKDLFHLKNMK